MGGGIFILQTLGLYIGTLHNDKDDDNNDDDDKGIKVLKVLVSPV